MEKCDEPDKINQLLELFDGEQKKQLMKRLEKKNQVSVPAI